MNLPKFIYPAQDWYRRDGKYFIYAILGYIENRKYFLVHNIVTGNLNKIDSGQIDNYASCQYDDKKIWTSNNDWAFYDSKTLLAQKLDGVAALIDGKKFYCWKGCITDSKEEFFESLSEEEKIKAAFNLDEF